MAVVDRLALDGAQGAGFEGWKATIPSRAAISSTTPRLAASNLPRNESHDNESLWVAGVGNTPIFGGSIIGRYENADFGESC